MDASVRVLHVDDDPDFGALVAEFLERTEDRFDVRTETNAEDGLARLAEGDVDCVVSDYQMPGRDGLDFLDAVREEYPDMPFILFTGEGSEGVASDAIAGGATDYLQKGHGTEQYTVLANRIENAVEQYHSRRRATALERVRAIARDVNGALVRASSRDEIESRVCTVLSEAEPYRFAWIGDVDESGRVRPRAWAGVEAGYLDELLITTDESDTGQGPAGRALRERRVVVSQNVHDDPDFEPWREAAVERGFASVAAVPLEYDETLYGGVGLYAEQPGAFDERERELLAELGDDIAHAIHAVELRVELARRERRMTQLYDATRDLFAATTPEEIADVAVDATRDVLEYPINAVRLLDDDGERLELVARTDPTREVLGDRPAYPVASTLAGRAFREGEAVVCEDVAEADDDVDRGDVGSAMYLPLGDHGTLSIGDTRRDAFDAADVELAQLLTTNATLALDRVERRQELERDETILKALGDPVYALDADGHFRFVNDAFVAATGYAQSELLGAHASMVLPDEALERGREVIVSLLKDDERRRATWEMEQLTADGDRIPTENHLALLPFGDDGSFRGNAGVIRDISDRKRRERQLERLHEATRRLFDAESPEGVAEITTEAVRDTLGYRNVVVRLVSEDGTKLRPVAVTHGARSMLGERPVYDVGEGTAGRAYARDETLVFGDVATVDDAFERGDASAGIYLPIGEYGTLSINDPDPDAFDESDVRLAELFAANAATALEQLEQNRELARQNKRLQEFASLVSHDLQNPLNVAVGRLELAREAGAGRDDDLGTVRDALNRMEDIIEGTLTLAREGQTVGEKRAVDLHDVAERCWQNVESGDATLRVVDDARISADPERLRHLFENLFSNAVAHAGPDVTVRVGRLGDDAGFYVADDGPGIPAADRESVFEPGRSTNDGSTGFGLTIVKRIAEAHGWTVDVTESDRGGARFEVTGVEVT